MRKLCTVPCGMVHFSGDVDVVLWEHGDPFPALGPSVGVDTETERFTDVLRDPPIVVLGVFDPTSATCYVVYWRDVAEFMRELCARDVEQRYFNLGYDEPVLDNEDPDKSLMLAIDANRVFDMSIRQKLHDIETVGYIRATLNTLAQCTKHYEHWELDKGDGSDDSARLSFKRKNPDGTDYVITYEQARYLPYDCIATWALGEAIPVLATDPQLGIPFELAHVKGMVVLAHITINGFPVDLKVWGALEDRLKADMDKYREELLKYGFPDPYKDEQQEAEDVRSNFHAQYSRLLALGGLTSGIPMDADGKPSMPQKSQLRLALLWMWMHEQAPDEIDDMIADVKASMEGAPRNMRKAEKSCWDQMCEDHELIQVDEARRAIVMQAYLGSAMGKLADILDTNLHSEYKFSELAEAADELLNRHPEWLTKTAAPSPNKFFQEHARKLMEDHQGLELDQTEKSGQIKLTSKDMWRLEDMGIEDKFLTSYTGFKHAQKLMSTYLDRKYICADGKVRAHYTNILRTGRTSASSPNV